MIPATFPHPSLLHDHSLKIDSSAMPFFPLPSPSRLSDPARAHHAYVMHMAWFSSPRHRIQCTPSRLQNLKKEVCNLAARFFFTLSKDSSAMPFFRLPSPSRLSDPARAHHAYGARSNSSPQGELSLSDEKHAVGKRKSTFFCRCNF